MFHSLVRTDARGGPDTPNLSPFQAELSSAPRRARLVLAATLLVAPLVAPLMAQSPAVQAAANSIGRLNAKPAATLLLPYFEVAADADTEYAPPSLEVTVVNHDDAPTLAHVTLWTDMSVPTLSFDIYLTGFDVETFDLNALFTDGTLPVTSSDVYPGAYSDPNVEFPGCDALLPVGALPASVVNYLRLAHSGLPIPAGFDGAGLCAGRYFGEVIYRGYVTIDVVSECTTLNPTDSGYFADDGQGVALNDNVLWGNYVDRTAVRASSELLVHVEAHSSVAEGFWVDGDPTFYGRYVDGSAIDNREPLATAWAGRYWNGAPLRGDAVYTDVLCWRDSGVEQPPFDCSLPPSPFPLGNGRTIAFNENENLTELLPEPLCPWEVTRVSVADLGIPFQAGWLYLDLGTGAGAAPQSFVTLVHENASNLSYFGFGYQATPLSSTLAPQVLATEDGTLLVDTFEDGNLNNWSYVN